MSSSRNKGKRPATDLQRNQQHRPLRFLKPIIRLPSFKLVYQPSVLLETTVKWQHRIEPWLARVLSDWTRKHIQPPTVKGTSVRSERCLQRACCINNPSSHKAKEIAQTHKTKWPFFVMDLTDRVLHSHLLPNVPHLSHFTSQRHTLFLSHGHIEVEATYTRFSGRRDGCFGVISGGWAKFASLCKFEPGGVGIFEVISTEPVTVLQVRWSNNTAGS
ncbi:hypothetical protein AHAS_Ahas04G0151400 [Arachis hypogaea]